MPQDFELVQTNTGKLLLVWVGGFAVVLAVAIKGNDLLLTGASKNLHLTWFLGVVLGGLYGLYRLGKAVSAVPTVVRVAPDRLTIFTPHSGEETQVPFADLAAYRASSYNGAEALRLTLHDARRLHVKINSRLYDGQDFGGMVAAFETAVGRFRADAGPAVAVRRERSFFEKPVSTVVWAVFTAFLVGTGWVIVTGPHPVKGSLFMALGSYLSYSAAWYSARARRNQPDGPE